jgi:transcription antitermination factor NusG
MSEELKKFTARYKQVEAELGDCSEEAASRTLASIRACSTNANAGFDELAYSLSDAIDAGFSGTISDFAKHSGVNNALKGIREFQAEQVRHVTRITSMKAVAERALPKLKTLQTDIAADLKDRDKKSKSRPGIEKLGDEVDERIKDISSVPKKFGLLKPVHMNPQAEFDSKIKALMQQSAKELKEKKETDNVPHQFEKKNITRTVKSTLSSYQAMVSACDESARAAAKGDKDEALKNLKSAKKEYETVKATAEEIGSAAKKFALDIANSKDRPTIDDAVDKITRMGAAGGRKLKETLDVLKSAKWTPATT